VNSTGKAAVIGIGTIGGSIASALRARGWEVYGYDLDEARMHEAAERRIIDHAGFETAVAITFVATPVSHIPEAVLRALDGPGVVTDVGSVKGSVTAAVHHPRFVAGHPMAGSERSGLDGVDSELFNGATWVLTPGPQTDGEAYATVRSVVNSLGADVVTLNAEQHDEMVATISHVPHLAASALMTLALRRAEDHDAVLRLAAGGFRDMTRIAAGHPGLWTDITFENKAAIVDELQRLAVSINDVASLLEKSDRDGMREFLDVAAKARKELPLRSGRPAALAIVRIPIPDRAGALGDVLGIFGKMRINVEDLDIAHDQKGDRGTLQVTIAQSGIESITAALLDGGFRSSVENL
jgi:prephenate dehydrogenase